MDDRFYTLLARKFSGMLSEAEGAELNGLLQAMPERQLELDLLEAMFAQERNLPPSGRAREAFVRHWLRYQAELLSIHTPGSLPAPASTDINVAKVNPSEQAEVGKPHMPEDASGWETTSLQEDGQSIRRAFRVLRFSLPVMAALFVVFVLGLLWKNGEPGKQESPRIAEIQQVRVSPGKKEQLLLPDGSRVWLNAGSTLEYDKASFNGDRREVFLSGEAYFDITHQANKPFFVRSGQVQIKVLGTVFNVKAYPGDQDIETSLIRGSVEVTLKDRPDDIYILRPNEKLIVSNGITGMVQREAADKGQQLEVAPLVSLHRVTVSDSGKLIHETAWVDDKMVFRAEPFASLAARMERRYGVRIQFRKPELSALQFTGIFTTETIGQALEAMRLVHQFDYVMDNENIYIQ